MAFCYSSLNGLRQSTFQLRIGKGEHDHPVSLEQSAFSALGLIRDPRALWNLTPWRDQVSIIK